jgi:hypothetical protein
MLKIRRMDPKQMSQGNMKSSLSELTSKKQSSRSIES